MNTSRAANPFAAAAQHLRDLHGSPDAANPSSVLCVTGHEGESATLRNYLAATDGLLPEIVSLPRLIAAAEAGADGGNARNFISAARLGAPSSSASRRNLASKIYALLRTPSHPGGLSALWSHSSSLAEFFTEFADSQTDLLFPREVLPELCNNLHDSGAYRREADAVSLVWDLIAPQFLAARQTLAQFAEVAPALIFVSESQNPKWTDDFLQRCKNGCEIFLPQQEHQVFLKDVAEQGAKAWNERISHIELCREGSAASPDEAAKLALLVLREFASDDQSVGVAVYDRLLARRLRALAEAAGIGIEDDGGWRMETLSFGGAMRQWTEAASGMFSSHLFSQLLSAPFWGDDKTRERASQAWRDVLCGEESLPNSWKDFNNLDKYKKEPFFPFAKQLMDANNARPSSAPLNAWTDWLLQHSQQPLAAWKEDSVATVLRASLASAAFGEQEFNAAEFNAWLHMFMRTETGGGRDVESRICFVPPNTPRQFDSLLLLGARAGNLPPPPDSFWGENGRRALQLPGRREHMETHFAQFAKLISAHKNIAAVWINAEGAQDASPSPFWVLLTDALKESGKTVSPLESELALAHDDEDNLNLPPPPDVGKGYVKDVNKIPQSVRITSAGALMTCPYHFFAVTILRLGEEEEEDMVTPLTRGRMLHDAMERFCDLAKDETDAGKLAEHWQAAFDKSPTVRTGAKFSVQHWLLRSATFIKEEAERRAEGWRPKLLEHVVRKDMFFDTHKIVLRGRLDRADYNADENRWAVTDYKSGSGPSAKDMKTGEDPQLPLYAFLLGTGTGEAAAATNNNPAEILWRITRPSSDKESVETSGFPVRIAARLRTAARRILKGDPMTAYPSGNCKGCASRRLCRRDHWQEQK